ncbi:MAG: phospho-sugar mutase [Planctomycetota bacterium]|nr:phospho-sugar mutase [Planctomycetota bacterium]
MDLKSTTPFDPAVSLQSVAAAVAAGQLTASAEVNIRDWLTEARYAMYAEEVAQYIADKRWKELDDAFWTIIPFGTGGRRGKMFPIGSNAVNDRTIGESAQGVANYIVAQFPDNKDLRCAIAYDTRHRSRHFAELCSEVMLAAGFTVYFLDGYRSTPELSFSVRYNRCHCGIMVTASHNPPSDNAVKVYWSTGCQVLPPHDAGIIERVMNAGEIRRSPFAEGVKSGKVIFCQKEVDAAFQSAVLSQALPGPRALKIIYSPLHGVGGSAVPPVLAADGFADVEIFGPHAEPNGDFPNVPNHVSNPENPAVFDIIIAQAQKTGADLILATDPDCDRLGCAAPLTKDTAGPWRTFSGNQIAALLTEYVLSARKKAGSITPDHYVVKTLVTTEMIRRVAESYNVRTLGNLQVGFKWIGMTMDEFGPDKFVLGCEESHGYLVGTHARDKDAAVAAMLLSELAAECKAAGQTLHDKLDSLYWQYGYHQEQQLSITMPGSQGMKDMLTIMAKFRATPPQSLAGMKVTLVRDYLSLTETRPGSPPLPLVGPQGDMVILDLDAPGNYVAVRPSGTEPKIKFYMFTCEAPELLADLQEAHETLQARMQHMQQELATFAKVG